MRVLKKIPREDLPKLYREHFVYDFHNAELMRPYDRIIELLDEGKYIAEGLYGDDGLEAYLFFSKTERFILLDFFAVVGELRGKGVGSEALKALTEQYSGSSVVLESEDPEDARDEEDFIIRNRRIAFYEKNGFRLNPLKVNLFGDRYRIMTKNGLESEAVLSEALIELYNKLYTEPVAKKYVRLG